MERCGNPTCTSCDNGGWLDRTGEVALLARLAEMARAYDPANPYAKPQDGNRAQRRAAKWGRR